MQQRSLCKSILKHAQGRTFRVYCPLLYCSASLHIFSISWSRGCRNSLRCNIVSSGITPPINSGPALRPRSSSAGGTAGRSSGEAPRSNPLRPEVKRLSTFLFISDSPVKTYTQYQGFRYLAPRRPSRLQAEVKPCWQQRRGACFCRGALCVPGDAPQVGPQRRATHRGHQLHCLHCWSFGLNPRHS